MFYRVTPPRVVPTFSLARYAISLLRRYAYFIITISLRYFFAMLLMLMPPLSSPPLRFLFTLMPPRLLTPFLSIAAMLMLRR